MDGNLAELQLLSSSIAEAAAQRLRYINPLCCCCSLELAVKPRGSALVSQCRNLCCGLLLLLLSSILPVWAGSSSAVSLAPELGMCFPQCPLSCMQGSQRVSSCSRDWDLAFHAELSLLSESGFEG